MNIRSALLRRMLHETCDGFGLPQVEASYLEPVVLLHVLDAVSIRLDALEGQTIMLDDESENR